jgi:hypothetical protein
MPQIHSVTNLRHELLPWLMEFAAWTDEESRGPNLYKVFNNITFGVIFGALLKSKQ